nr:hypothetical protein [Stenotrophomonas terrae]
MATKVAQTFVLGSPSHKEEQAIASPRNNNLTGGAVIPENMDFSCQSIESNRIVSICKEIVLQHQVPKKSTKPPINSINKNIAKKSAHVGLAGKTETTA